MGAKKTILIIDDDHELNDLLGRYLTKFELEVVSATNPIDGLEIVRKHPPNLIILDVMLPGKTGFEVCREIRQEAKVPIIMLTARGGLSDRVIGLELGADDYMAKPYEPRELLARIQSVLRRTEGYSEITPSALVLKSADLKVDVRKATVCLSGARLEFTTTEFEILCLLMRNPGATLSRDQIVDQLKGIVWNNIDRTIDVLVSRIRHKLNDDPKSPRYLKTIWGSGYRFIGEVIREGT